MIIELVREGRLPLPNFFADIGLRHPELLDMTSLERFTRPYHDVLSVPLSQFADVVEMLKRAGHPLAQMLERYSAVFFQQPFEPLPAAQTFVKVTSVPATGRPLNQGLMSLFTTLQQAPYAASIPFDLCSHSSLAHFKARLEHYFGPDFGFQLRLSAIVYARSYEANHEAPSRARIRRVGIGQNCVEWPAPAGMAADQLKPRPRVDSEAVAPETHVLREAAVYSLVATKRLPVLPGNRRSVHVP
jgi:hypothetical protein